MLMKKYLDCGGGVDFIKDLNGDRFIFIVIVYYILNVWNWIYLKYYNE